MRFLDRLDDRTEQDLDTVRQEQLTLRFGQMIKRRIESY